MVVEGVVDGVDGMVGVGEEVGGEEIRMVGVYLGWI